MRRLPVLCTLCVICAACVLAAYVLAACSVPPATVASPRTELVRPVTVTVSHNSCCRAR